MYTSTLIAIWQRLLSLNISWYFDTLSKVITKKRIFTVVVPSAGDKTGGRHLFDTTNIKAKVHQPI
jgi:hypothetical protein